MGPIALFDKSFLEGLNLDEAVLFDHFFYGVTCPIFYVETLADLEKDVKHGRTPEQVVGTIALKTPQMHGAPNVHHRELVQADLLGRQVAMKGRIHVAGGVPFELEGKKNVVFRPTPEAEAFDRWQRGDFESIERRFAKAWRDDLRRTSLAEVADKAARYGLDLSACKTMEHARDMAARVIDALAPEDQIAFALERFSIGDDHRGDVYKAWHARGALPLDQYAPYARYVLLLEIFFEIALATGKISTERASNISDLAYLFYLPFVMTFMSSDRLHRTCAPLFMRDDQMFVWGIDLKAELRANHEALIAMPEEVRKQGLVRWNPPPRRDGLIAEIINRTMRRASGRVEKPLPTTGAGASGRAAEPRLVDLPAHVQRLVAAAKEAAGDATFEADEVDSLTIQRWVSKQRGSYFQLPDDIEHRTK